MKPHVLTFSTSGQPHVTTCCTCAVTSPKKCHVSGCRREASDVCCLSNHSYDYRPNWTPLNPITITYYIHSEITDDPSNLIGSQQCDLFTNHPNFFCALNHICSKLRHPCSKSLHFCSKLHQFCSISHHFCCCWCKSPFASPFQQTDDCNKMVIKLCVVQCVMVTGLGGVQFGL